MEITPEMAVTPEEVLTELGDINLMLFSFQVESFVQSLPISKRSDFTKKRDGYRLKYLDLSNQKLLQLSSNFAENAQDLKKGIDNLKGEINALKSTTAILNAIGNVLGTIAKIIPVL